MTDRWSRGYCVRMSVSSATATFLAARKQPRSSIERLMSTSSTVDGLGQLLGPVDLEVVGREVDARSPRARRDRRRVLLAGQRVGQRAAQVEVERVAELVRLGRLLALPAPAGTLDAMAAERVALEPREQVVEHLLADPPAAPRRQLEPLPVAGQVAGLLEPPGQVVERVEVADGVVAQQVAHLVAVDRRRGRPAPSTSDSASSSRSIACEPARSAPARPRARAARRRRTARARRARRAGAGPGSRRAGPGRPASRSSRSSASIIDSSSARCSGLIERMQRLHRGHPLRRAGR